MASGLDKLASNLDDDQCKHLKGFYKGEEFFRLMRLKGICPYEYMDSWKKFEETRLPGKNAYYSRLNMKGISDQVYEHAQQVWSRITPKHKNVTLGDYHDVCLATDVLLLADEFETFRNTYLGHYNLQSWSKYLAQIADVYNPFQSRHCQLSIPPTLTHLPLQCCDFWDMN